MKLDKLQRVLEKHKIDELENYNVDNLDLDRVPDPANYSSTQKKYDVDLLLNDGKRKSLKPGELTRFEADRDDLEGIEVIKYPHPDAERQYVKKFLFIN